MSDTAQELAPADPNAQLDDAAAAFKAFLNPGQPRDEQGRFSSATEESEIEAEAEAGAEEGVEPEQQEEAADEAQPEPVAMPTSWSKDDAEVWAALPPDAQAKIAEREGQRDAAVNAKFQEAANVRKANEALVTEANANRTRYAEAIDQVLSLVSPQKPLRSHYDDRDSYDLAVEQYEQSAAILSELLSQREHIRAQEQTEAQRLARQSFEAVENEARPKLIADVPEIADPAKAQPVLNEIVQWAIGHGVPADTFSGPAKASLITSSELHMAWKAMQYDKLKAAQAKVKAEPKPARQASPALRPGVTTPRAAIEQQKHKAAMDRLMKEGSIEAGAAVFRNMFKGM